jgi:Putative transposase
VLAFPFALRIHLARDNAFFSEMLRGFVRTVFNWQRRQARALGIPDGQPAAVAMLQFFGSAIQLHPHVHTQIPDGLWVPGRAHTMTFAELPPPTDEDVATLTHKIARRLTKVARRYLAEHEDEWYDPDDEQAARDHCLQAAVRPPVRPTPPLPFGEPLPSGPEPKPLCAQMNGFSLHAATHVAADDRDALERLCKYGLRAPFAQDRLSLLPDGRVRYELRRPWPTPNGATALVFEPLQLMRRLASLIPRPYTNLVRYFGAFAGRSKYRARLPLPPEAQADASHEPCCVLTGVPADDRQLTLALSDETTGDTDEAAPEVTLPVPRGPRAPWASLLKRAFGIDALHCECGATMTVLAMITAPHSLERILSHFDLPTHPPPIAPARLDPQTDFTLDELPPDDTYPDEPPRERSRHAASRAPP